MRSNPGRAPTVALAASLLLCGACSSRSGSDSESPSVTATEVKLTAAQRQHIQLYTVATASFHKAVEVTGVVDFDNEQATSVLAPFSGPVSQLLASPGDRVKAGDGLAVVDSPDFASAVSAYRKALSTAQTNRRLADLDKDLMAHNGVSQREAAQAETDAIGAEADRDAALRALVSLQVPAETIRALQEGRPVAHPGAMIRSPIAGTVVERLITPGQLLEASTTACFTVANLSRMWVMAQLFGPDLAVVSRGDPATITTGDASVPLTGTVDHISDLVDPDTRAVAVRVVAENPAHVLRKQMYVRVRIQSQQESAGLLIPVSAILRDDENLPFVYLVRSDGAFARQRVTLGPRTDDRYQVLEGLHAGEQIAIAGGLFVQFMQSQ
jgi:cobalt-zinc-cadmium efflux system membrane fusion protein